MIGLEVTSENCCILLDGQHSPFDNGRLILVPVEHEAFITHMYSFLADTNSQDIDSFWQCYEGIQEMRQKNEARYKEHLLPKLCAFSFEQLPDLDKSGFLLNMLSKEVEMEVSE